MSNEKEKEVVPAVFPVVPAPPSSGLSLRQIAPAAAMARKLDSLQSELLAVADDAQNVGLNEHATALREAASGLADRAGRLRREASDSFRVAWRKGPRL